MRIIGIALLVLSVIAFVVELHAPGLGIWGAIGLIALLLGGWFLYDRSSGVHVAPGVLVGVAIFAGLFFGLVVAKALQLRHVPPGGDAQDRRRARGSPSRPASGPMADRSASHPSSGERSPPPVRSPVARGYA